MLQTGNFHVMKFDNAKQDNKKGKGQRGLSVFFITVNESIL